MRALSRRHLSSPQIIMTNTTVTLDELAAVDAELEALTVKLERARQKKAAVQAQKERAAKAAAAKNNNNNNNNDLQRQIETLQRQLETNESSVSMEATDPASGGNDSPRRPVRRPTIVRVNQEERDDDDPHEQAPVAPVRRPTVILDSEVTKAVVEQIQEEEEQQSQPPPSPVVPAQAAPAPVKGASEATKRQHGWEKPDWALPSTDAPDEHAIETDSIQNPLLKSPQPGYERKVHAADLKLIAGKFVAHQEKKPDPRLVWIVVNVDGMKLGKIVMHLYGNVLPLVDTFLELKGLVLQRRQPGQMLVVEDMDPAFYVHHGTPSNFRGPTSACFGVVIEGQEVVQQVLNADAEALITIKQSHIYPVKKGRS